MGTQHTATSERVKLINMGAEKDKNFSRNYALCYVRNVRDFKASAAK
jgi:hypothetical protein